LLRFENPEKPLLLCVDRGIELNGIEDALELFVVKPTFLGGFCKTDKEEYDAIVCTIVNKLKPLLRSATEIMPEPLISFYIET
jgi:hypothetical protein